MAMILVATIQRWQGHSLDERPAIAPEGSEIHCVDNGEEWVYHNGGWVPDLRRVYAMKMAYR